MGSFTLLPISPNDGTLLLVKIEQCSLESGCYGQIDGDGGFTNTALQRNESYFLDDRNPSSMQ